VAEGFLKAPFCKKDEEYIPEELWELWNEIFNDKIGAYHFGLVAHSIYHYISDPVYYGQGGPPPPKNEDILCIIHYPTNTVTYLVKNQEYETLKDYICALKNISFL